MKASDSADDVQAQVVAPLPKSSGEDSDDDEKEERAMADDVDDVVVPDQIPLVVSLESELDMAEDRINVDHTACRVWLMSPLWL